MHQGPDLRDQGQSMREGMESRDTKWFQRRGAEKGGRGGERDPD